MWGCPGFGGGVGQVAGQTEVREVQGARPLDPHAGGGVEFDGGEVGFGGVADSSVAGPLSAGRAFRRSWWHCSAVTVRKDDFSRRAHSFAGLPPAGRFALEGEGVNLVEVGSELKGGAIQTVAGRRSRHRTAGAQPTGEGFGGAGDEGEDGLISVLTFLLTGAIEAEKYLAALVFANFSQLLPQLMIIIRSKKTPLH